MDNKISVIINTLNEEKNIERAIKSVKWADEIVVCDMHSEDKTVRLAQKLGAKIVFHEKTNYVEPARNFAVSKSLGDWILILDADEEISTTLATRLQEIVTEGDNTDFVEIPRRNIIFGKQINNSLWWPDYHPRFYKRGKVVWKNEIHAKPETNGTGLTLPVEVSLAIIHHHYQTLIQFIERMNRYTTIQANELTKDGYKFYWLDLINKPVGEFMNRYFASRGFEDGLHGLVLGFLQAFSFLVMYLKVWEIEKFKEQEIKLDDFKKESKKIGREMNYWFKYANLSKNPFKRFAQKIKNKIS